MEDNEKREKVLTAISNVLIEKNKRYGNAALSPINVFYRGDATNSIAIRLDDKLSRIKNSTTLRKNDMFDLLGYLFLYKISTNCIKGLTFEEQIQTIINDIKSNGVTELNDDIEIENVFDKENTGDINLVNLNIIYSALKKLPHYILGNGVQCSIYTINFIICLIDYFVNNDITEFSELLD